MEEKSLDDNRPHVIAEELRFYTDDGIRMLNECLKKHGLKLVKQGGG